MPAKVFISYDHDDEKQVDGFKSLVDNPNHPLDFQDHSLKEPVKDKNGKPIKLRPSDAGSKPVREEILKKFDKASRLVVLIGDDTHKSEWVAWEIEEFYKLKKKLSGEKTAKRIRGMRLKGCEKATVPAALQCKSMPVLDWDPKGLDKWLDSDLE